MRRAVCSKKCCNSPLLFSRLATVIQCRMCKTAIPVSSLKAVELNPDEEIAWMAWKAELHEKRGWNGLTRSRMANQIIDGINNYAHLVVLQKYFENCGVDEQREVKTLAEMGRIQPFNLPNLGGYAFGIRFEHLDVLGYGREGCAARFLHKTISEIGKSNGIPVEQNPLVPLVVDSTPVINVCSAISRATVGREVFARLMRSKLIEHMKKLASVYQSRSAYDEDVWDSVQQTEPFMTPKGRPLPIDLQLAAMANVMGRTILLLDDRRRVFKTYVPFLWKSEHCPNGKLQRWSPLALGYFDESHQSVLPLVCTAERSIKPIFLPRQWFKDVWGANAKETTDHLLSRYLDFNDEGKCLVANGKYFKSELLRRIVSTFEKYSFKEIGVHPRVLSEYAVDENKPVTEMLPLELSRASADGELWRCLRCERIVEIQPPLLQNCPDCRCNENLRQMYADGTVQYKNGDHTCTRAPKSWCFVKRKHHVNGLEYDNPPMKLTLQIPLSGELERVVIDWFTGESSASMNSTVAEVAGQLSKKYRAFWIQNLEELVASQVRQQVNSWTILEHKRRHLNDTFNNVQHQAEPLLDDPTFGKSLPKADPETLDVEKILSNANQKCSEYAFRRRQLCAPLNRRANTVDAAREVKELNDRWGQTEDSTFTALSRAMSGYDEEKKYRTICSREVLFRPGGLLYYYARRWSERQGAHFALPLMGNVQFVLDDERDEVLVCIPGGHFSVCEAVDAICAFSTNDTQYPCDYQTSRV